MAGFALAADAAVLGFDHAFDDGEAESGGGFAAGGAGGEAGEFAEEAFHVGGGEAGAFVGHFAADGAVAWEDADADGFAARGVFDGVGEEVIDDLHEAVAVGPDVGGGGWGVEEEGLLFGGGAGLIGGDDVGGDGGEVAGGGVEFHFTAFDGVGVEQVSDQLVHVFGGAADDFEHVGGIGSGEGGVGLDELGGADDLAAGVPEVVGGDAEELVFLVVEFAQVLVEADEGFAGAFEFDVGVDAGEEFGGIEGFGDVIDGAGVEGIEEVLEVVTGGEEDDGHGGGGGLLFESAADFESVHAGHHEVEEDEVWEVSGDAFEGLGAVGGGHDVIAGLGEHGADEPEVLDGIIDNEDTGVGAVGSGGWWCDGGGAGVGRGEGRVHAAGVGAGDGGLGGAGRVSGVGEG